MIRRGFLDSESRKDLIELARDGSASHRLARRANALVLLDDGMSCEAVAKALLLDDDTIRTWHRLYEEEGIEGLSSFGYEGSACRLSEEQQDKLKAWITETLPRTTREVGARIENECGIEYQGRSGLVALLHRLGMEHRKPKTVSRKLDPEKQASFIKAHEALLNQMDADEVVLFADAVHPTHAVRPVGCWAPKDTPIAVPQTSGRQRLNIHGAIDLETGHTRMLEVETVDAASTIKLMIALLASYLRKRVIPGRQRADGALAAPALRLWSGLTLGTSAQAWSDRRDGSRSRHARQPPRSIDRRRRRYRRLHGGKGDRVAFILSYSLSTDRLPRRLSVDALLEKTEKAWIGWIGRFDVPCRWPDAVKRSLLTLRTLIDRKSGGIVAAATLGLPELPGGSLNWDYRYCWLRDSTFTLTALVNAGLHEKAKSWRDWILRAVGGEPSTMQIVYRIDGRRRLPEHELGGLPGYRGARPVRVGNAASGQTQLDVFGELMNSFHVLAKAGIARTPRVIEVETAVVRHLELVWDRPSADIWESRGEPQLYSYSQVMAWVGIDRFLKAHEGNGDVDPALISRLKALGETIHHTICERGYSSDYGHFIQHYESDTLDASLLLLPLVGFLPVEDFRIAGTIAAVERKLMEGGLVRRKGPSAEGPDEGAFLVCSCWLADCYKMQGRDEEAAALLERVIGLSNDVGLLSEEYHVPSRSLAGNMPQALTHLGVVNTALFLSGPVVQRAGG